MKKRVFQTAEISGRKIAILLDETTMTAYEAVWMGNCWVTDFCYPAIGINAFDVAGALDFDKIREMGYTFAEA